MTHPITPPPELVQEWTQPSGYKVLPGWLKEILQKTAQWGADQELEACCEWLRNEVNGGWGLDNQLTAARRPKPSSLKEQALETLKYPKDLWSEDEVNTIRRALEQLDD